MLTDSPWLSALIWLVLIVTAPYLGRSSARGALMALARTLRSQMRLLGRTLSRAQNGLAARSREVLLTQGQEAKERLVSREFERITATVNRDLARYPETQRLLSETIARIDEDHQNATDVPPEVPAWQTIQATLKRTDRAVNSILERSRSIDRHMEDYEAIVAGRDHAVRSLSTSALVQFAIAALVIILVEMSIGLFLMESLRITPCCRMSWQRCPRCAGQMGW